MQQLAEGNPLGTARTARSVAADGRFVHTAQEHSLEDFCPWA
jgi:hypothetical protein